MLLVMNRVELDVIVIRSSTPFAATGKLHSLIAYSHIPICLLVKITVRNTNYLS